MRGAAPVVPVGVVTRSFFVAPSMTNVVYNPVQGVDLGALQLR